MSRLINHVFNFVLLVNPVDSMRPHEPATYFPDAPVCARQRLFFGVRIRLGMNFNYLILWVRVKGQG